MFKLVCSKKKGEIEKEMYYVIFCSPGQVKLIQTMGYKKGDTLIVKGVPELESKLDDKGNYIDKFSIREPNISFGLKAKGNMSLMSLEDIAKKLDPSVKKDQKLKSAIEEYLGLIPPSQEAKASSAENQVKVNLISWRDCV